MLRHHPNLRNNHGVILWALITIITICLVCGVMYLVYDEIDYYHKEGIWKDDPNMSLQDFFDKRQDEGVTINTQAFAVRNEEPLTDPPPMLETGDPDPVDPPEDPIDATAPTDPVVDESTEAPIGGVDEGMEDLFAPPN